MRILYAMPSPSSTGGMRMLTDMYYRAGIFDREGYFHFDTYYSWGTSKAVRFIQNIFQKIEFSWILLVKKIDIVYVMSSSNWGFYDKVMYCLIARILGKKAVLNPVGGHFIMFYQRNKLNQFLVPKLLAIPNGVISGTSYWYSFFRDTFNLKNLIDIPNPVKESTFERPQSKKKNDLTITFLARVEKEKGALLFKEYICESLKKGGNHTYVIVGKGPALAEIEHELKQAISEKKVIIAGFVDEDEKDKIFRRTDIYVLPTEFEVLPISLLEAMTYGCAIVSSNVGGIPDAIQHGVTGLLMETCDLATLSNRIEELIDNIELRHMMGQNAKELIHEYYALDVVLERHYKFFKQICR